MLYGKLEEFGLNLDPNRMGGRRSHLKESFDDEIQEDFVFGRAEVDLGSGPLHPGRGLVFWDTRLSTKSLTGNNHTIYLLQSKKSLDRTKPQEKQDYS